MAWWSAAAEHCGGSRLKTARLGKICVTATEERAIRAKRQPNRRSWYAHLRRDPVGRSTANDWTRCSAGSRAPRWRRLAEHRGGHPQAPRRRRAVPVGQPRAAAEAGAPCAARAAATGRPTSAAEVGQPDVAVRVRFAGVALAVPLVTVFAGVALAGIAFAAGLAAVALAAVALVGAVLVAPLAAALAAPLRSAASTAVARAAPGSTFAPTLALAARARARAPPAPPGAAVPFRPMTCRSHSPV